MPTMGKRNTISGNFVDTGTKNRPLRLRGERGKIYQRTPPWGVFIIQNVWQQTFRNIHFLRKYMAANTPQGVGADSSRPFFNPNQMVLMCRNDANCNAIWWNYVGAVWGIAMPTVENCNAILWVFVDTGTINRTPTAADGLPFCGCIRICKHHKIVHQRTLATRYNTTTYTECLLSQCKNHTFAM